MIENNEPPRLIDTATASQRLGVSAERVRQWLREGRIRGWRIGGRYVVDPANLRRPKPARRGELAEARDVEKI